MSVFKQSLAVAAAACIVAIGALLGWGSAASASSARVQITSSDVNFFWDPVPVGSSTLVRTDSGISATLQTSGLDSGHVMTLWWVIFNSPEKCATSPCGPNDLFSGVAGGDFLFAAGRVVGGSGKATFAGQLAVGDDSGSAFYEIGMPELAHGLTNPQGAEVHLLVHSHGPAVPGRTLQAQLSSFLGGCEEILGNDFGLAEGPEDMPTERGQCVTFQGSMHF
jgi:hypothetical protein